MDAEQNAPLSANSVLDFLPGDNMEGGEDMSLEWLSIFIEDCLSSTTTTTTTTTTTNFQPLPTPNHTTHPNPQPPTSSVKPLMPTTTAKPSKSRPRTTMRRKLSRKAHPYSLNNSLLLAPSELYPPLLHQTQWLAESEFIFPKKDEEEGSTSSTPKLAQALLEEGDREEKVGQQQARRCTHCLSHRTPQWRAGPMGPKTLCNACGVRFKSGRLLPEYRPAKSPTFVTYKHSNSHKKVMEMRMAIPSTTSN